MKEIIKILTKISIFLTGIKIYNKVLLTLLSFLLVIIGKIIYDKIKETKQKNQIQFGILTELNEIKLKLVNYIALLTIRIGKVDQEFFKFILPYEEIFLNELTNENGEKEKLKQAYKHLSEINNNQLNQTLDLFRLSKIERAISLKKINFAFLDSNIRHLNLFDKNFQSKIIETKNDIVSINEEIDKTQSYIDKTFDSSISEENHKIIKYNLNSSYKSINTWAKDLVKKIENIIETYKMKNHEEKI